MFSLICAWTSGWANIRDAVDLGPNRARYDATVMCSLWKLKRDMTNGVYIQNPSPGLRVIMKILQTAPRFSPRAVPSCTAAHAGNDGDRALPPAMSMAPISWGAFRLATESQQIRQLQTVACHIPRLHETSCQFSGISIFVEQLRRSFLPRHES